MKASCHPDRPYHARGLCQGCYAKRRAETPELRTRDRLKARDSQLRLRYGISAEEFSRLKLEQGGVCAICRTAPKGRWGSAFYVDHDHATGKVRGLLCSNCNTGLGLFNDSSEVLLTAISYLTK